MRQLMGCADCSQRRTETQWHDHRCSGEHPWRTIASIRAATTGVTIWILVSMSATDAGSRRRRAATTIIERIGVRRKEKWQGTVTAHSRAHRAHQLCSAQTPAGAETTTVSAVLKVPVA